MTWEGFKMFNPTIDVIVAQSKFRRPPDMTFEGILKRFPGLAEADAVCWTGSTAIGWGNVFSDFDLFAFSDRTLELPVDETMERWPGSDKSGISWENWMGEYEKARVDLTIWSPDAFATVLQPYLDDEVELCGTSDAMLAFVYRMSIAVPLKNDDYFREMHELLARSSFRRARARTPKVWAENALTDVAGQLDAGDHASALISARVAAFRVTDACLALYGDYCHAEKWTMRRLESKPECGISVDEFRSEVLAGIRPGESDGDAALRMARWAQKHIVRLEGEFLAVS
ncbi:hypothetical protein [Micromonospora cathayae]|uniref:Nucleotidyltransferase domain-containing protein n=1 Tax=Micromonospora cathayae TaxID=3028804 RepID=A0ABY7ZT86_9ACTN|nr:hypothetical protein [Micromonospora sp. HUAS 3]WDZ86240.1 hypothetical protein PVK37_07485 [Micromonospora sp. HUAS 3]